MKFDLLKVLLVDDDEDDYIITEELLDQAEICRFQLDWIETYEKAIKIILKQKHDVYLFDYRLGADNGLELLREVLALGCQKPIILLTGLGDHEIDQEAMRLGASDYLVKGQINTPLLERAILHALERKEAELKQAELLLELEAANQELQAFAYIVSHDLKAPLRGIMSLATWISQDYTDQLDSDGQEMLKLMNRRVMRMNSLIDGILQYSKLGKVKEEAKVVSLHKLVLEIIESLAPHPQFIISIKSRLPDILGDQIRLEQLWQNLISNAIKYNDKPQGKVIIDAQELEDYWQFRINDNGSGIDSQNFEKIFNIFQTLVPSDQTENTGIGLALVKKIVETYQGKVWLESEVGLGTTFYFTLPKSMIILPN
jgi:light-regulated signal transduction histidine kinase (bacteriophytochrome)